MKSFVCTVLSLLTMFNLACAQPGHYSVSNAHSHNDYLQVRPFAAAYEAKFGSIEVDIFLRDGQLLVAHDTASLPAAKSLQSLYLNPLAAAIDQNNGTVYPDRSKQLILLIDLKTEAVATLAKLMEVLNEYPDLKACSTLRMVITGNQPANITHYPLYLFFDGNFKRIYSQAELKRVALFSDSFKNYSKWNGQGSLDEQDKMSLAKKIKWAHHNKKPVRFWAAPDTPDAWRQLMKMGADFINTDHVAGLSQFFNDEKQHM